MICMFFIGTSSGAIGSVLSALLLTLVILLGIGMTFFASKLLSLTVLKGVPSSFTLELPPYRKPQIGKVIVRSIFDRTLFVLGRSVAVAAPAAAAAQFTVVVLATVKSSDDRASCGRNDVFSVDTGAGNIYTFVIHFAAFFEVLRR